MGTGRRALAGGRAAVGELLAVVGEDLVDARWCGLDEALKEPLAGACGFVLAQFQVDQQAARSMAANK